MAGRYDLEIDCGATFNLVVTWEDSSGNLVDLTGYDARMKLRKTHKSPEILSLTSGNGLTLGGVEGTVSIEITAEQTANLSGGGVYDLEVVSPGGRVTRLIEGKWIATPEVTY